jgi:hypothetical protein
MIEMTPFSVPNAGEGGRARRHRGARIAGIVQFRDGAARSSAQRSAGAWKPSMAPRSIVLKPMLKIAVANTVPVLRAQ